MTCDERQDLILFHAAGQLEPAEEAALRQHLATGCPVCVGRLAEAQELLGHVGLSPEPVSPHPIARSKLLERLDENASAAREPLERTALTGPFTGPRRPWGLVVGASALAACVACFGTFYAMQRDVNARQNRLDQMTAAADATSKELTTTKTTLAGATTGLAEARGQLATLRQQFAAAQADSGKLKNDYAGLQKKLDEATHVIDMLRSKDLQVAKLETTPNQPQDAMGRLFWDKDHNVWHFMAMNMKPAPAGKTYELWAIADGKPIAAGTFAVSDNGQGAVEFALPATLKNIQQAAVTDEPPGGLPAPSGTPQLAGKVVD